MYFKRFDAHRAVRNAPVNFKEQDHAVFGNAWEKDIPESGYFELKNARVFGDAVFHPRSLSFFSKHTHLYPRTFSTRLRSFLALRKPVQEIEQAIWITDNLSFNYFHWMLDALPRLMLLHNKYAGMPVLLPARYKEYPYVEYSLQMLNRTAVFLESEHAKVGKLILTTHAAGTGNYNKTLVNELRTAMMAPFPTRPQRKIYLSREKSIRRKITNEQALRTMLIKFGFEIHCFEDYSFDKQVAIMKETTVLVGLHGAGLANMLFMPEGGRVLEIRNAGDCHNNCYFALASELNHLYYYHIGAGNKADTFDADITVDLPELEKVAKTLYRDIVVH